MAESVQTIASRCLAEADFVRAIYEGNDFPDVRAAILADLLDAGFGEANTDVAGYLNPCPLPPKYAVFIDPTWGQWNSLPRVNLTALSNVRQAAAGLSRIGR